MSQDDLHSQDAASSGGSASDDLGLAGRTARFFIRSPLSPLFYVSMLLMGVLGLVLTPRQEDPQISVPMIDIMVEYRGASAQQVSNIATQPLERIMSEIPGVKHVYSASERGEGIVTVEFDVGEEMGPSLVKVNDKIASNLDRIPPGVSPPLVKSKGIDDVPIVTLTLWSRDLDGNGLPDVDDGQLRLLAQDVLQAVKEVKNTGSGFIVGGRREQVTVDVLPARLSSYQISLDQVAQTIRTANAERVAGGVESSGTHFSVTTGSFLQGAEDIERLVVGTRNEVPVYVRDVARVTRGPEDAEQLVTYYTGPAASEALEDASGVPAVTVAIAKKELTNGVTVADAIMDRVEELKGTRIPNNVEVSVTRNYGETADDKVSELIFKLFIATGWVFLLVWVAFRALRPAFVVLLVIPVVLLMTIFVAWVGDYTIDRVSLFALIFSIGILVDDAIVVVENIYRRWLEQGRMDEDTAVDAVREVGNPTILATFTVIAALLPMGFVSGMMGPYMEPIPALGSVAMLISLFAAFVFTPYLAISGWLRPSMRYLETAEKREHRESENLERFFRRLLTPLIDNKRKRRTFRLVLWGTFAFALSFFYFTWVPVKMLPLDNKPEFSVVLNMPDGTALPVTANLAHRLAEGVRTIPEVTAVQLYAGTARPFDFNGMVRHYYLRADPWHGELQVQLTHKKKRERSSHEIAVEARAKLNELIEGTGARIAVVEMPPGPPVLQSVVAEIHGPTPEVRRAFAEDMTDIFAQAESTTDVDNYLREPFDYWRFQVETEKAVRRGVSVDVINRNLAMALGGSSIGDVKQQAGHEPVEIVLQVPLAERSQVERLGDLPVQSAEGFTIPLRELGTFQRLLEEDVIYRKDLRPIEYVVSDVGGKLAAPVYAMLQIQDIIEETNYEAPDGVVPGSYWMGPPPTSAKSAWEWTGEWTVTYETFRDMGAAFAVALVLIYILVVWEFGNFRIPLVIMAPIPLTLLGIIPAHFLAFQFGYGGEFTATSMIGWIALAGIIVRNSILLVDFSIHELQKGVPVAEAVIRACKTRTRPILITALALVAGSSVIFTDPIFQGMAISLASGVLVSTILTLIVIPLGCVAASKDMCAVAVAKAPPGVTVPCTMEEPAEAKAQEASAASGGRLARLVAWIREALVLVFYALRGIGLLLFDAVKGLIARRRAARRKGASPPPQPPTSGGSPPSGGSGAGPTGGGSSPAIGAGASDTGQASQTPTDKAGGAVPAGEESRRVSASGDAARTAGGDRDKAARTVPPQAAAGREEGSSPAEGQVATKARSAAGRRSKPAAGSRAATGRRKTDAKAEGSPSKSPRPSAEAGSAKARSGGPKKTAHRGIRLKGDDSDHSN